MLNIIWLGMIGLSLIFGLINGHTGAVVKAATDSAKLGFETALGLSGIMALWLGLMNVGIQAKLIEKIARWLRPIMTRLFPDVPAEHPAMGAMVLNITANMLGIGSAATPFGLQAMKELQTLNTITPLIATDAMCTFLAINTSSVQLVPATAIAYLAANGSTHPSSVIISSLLATSISTLVAIISVKQLRYLPMFRVNASQEALGECH